MELGLRHWMLAGVTALAVTGAAVAADMSDEAIAERIQPVGSVYLEGEAPAETANAEPKSGSEIYGTYCVACHGAGIAGAPKTGDAAQWEPRLAQGIEVVYEHAIKGFNAMPAKGTCMACSDEEIIAAVEHMIEGMQ